MRGGNTLKRALPKRRAKSAARRGLYSVRRANLADAARSNAARLFTEKNKSCPAMPLRQTDDLNFLMARIVGAQGKSSLSREKIADSNVVSAAVDSRLSVSSTSD